MAEKDILEKSLLSYEDVFTDCINTLVYDGRRRLEEGRTQPARRGSATSSATPAGTCWRRGAS